MEEEKISLEQISPDTLVELTYYADMRSNSLQLIRDYCMFEQGRYQCTGDLRRPCYQKFDSCTCKRTCADEIGRMYTRFETIPDWIRPFKTKWTPETFELRGIISDTSIRTNMRTAEKEVDSHRRTLATIQYLLKEWDLNILLDLEPIPKTRGWKRLNSKTMEQIKLLPPDFIDLLAEGVIIKNKKVGNDFTQRAGALFKGGNPGVIVEEIYTFKILWEKYGIPYHIAKTLPSSAVDALLAVVSAETKAQKEETDRINRR